MGKTLKFSGKVFAYLKANSKSERLQSKLMASYDRDADLA